MNTDTAADPERDLALWRSEAASGATAGYATIIGELPNLRVWVEETGWTEYADRLAKIESNLMRSGRARYEAGNHEHKHRRDIGTARRLIASLAEQLANAQQSLATAGDPCELEPGFRCWGCPTCTTDYYDEQVTTLEHAYLNALVALRFLLQAVAELVKALGSSATPDAGNPATPSEPDADPPPPQHCLERSATLLDAPGAPNAQPDSLAARALTQL